MSSWIKMLSDEMADTELKQALDEARTPHGTVDNVLTVSYTHLTLPTNREV